MFGKIQFKIINFSFHFSLCFHVLFKRQMLNLSDFMECVCVCAGMTFWYRFLYCLIFYSVYISSYWIVLLINITITITSIWTTLRL